MCGQSDVKRVRSHGNKASRHSQETKMSVLVEPHKRFEAFLDERRLDLAEAQI